MYIKSRLVIVYNSKKGQTSFTDLHDIDLFRGDVKISMNLLQEPTEPSKRVSYTVGDHCRHFKKLILLSLYVEHSKPIQPTGGTIVFCDLSHRFQKFFLQVFIIFMGGIFASLLTGF